MPPKLWQELVQELLAHAVIVRDSAAGMTLKALRAAPATRHAVATGLTQMGDVVQIIPLEVQQRFPAVPWTKIKDWHHRVKSASRLDAGWLWQVSQVEMPLVINALAELMGD